MLRLLIRAIPVRALTVTLLGASSIHAADPWVKLSTPHFTLYTTAGALVEVVLGAVVGAALYKESAK